MEVFDASKPTWSDSVPRATAPIEPGMKLAMWCDQGNTMCPPATRAKYGKHPLFDGAFNPQTEDIDAIIAEADKRKAEGHDVFVLLDFEDWSASPQMYPRIAELLRYFKLKSGRPVGFYPGWLGTGATSNDEIIAVQTGKPWHGVSVSEARRKEIIDGAAKVARVYAECDFIALDLYLSKDADITTDAVAAWEHTIGFYRTYCPAREIIPWVGSHQAAVDKNPPISVKLLPAYARVLAKYSTNGRYIVWGAETLEMHLLARLLMGEAVDVQAVAETARIKAALKAAGE